MVYCQTPVINFTMKAIIIEDEKLSAEHLENLLKKIDSTIEIVAIVDSVKKSLALFASGIKADLLFVDIHLAAGELEGPAERR